MQGFTTHRARSPKVRRSPRRPTSLFSWSSSKQHSLEYLLPEVNILLDFSREDLPSGRFEANVAHICIGSYNKAAITYENYDQGYLNQIPSLIFADYETRSAIDLWKHREGESKYDLGDSTRVQMPLVANSAEVLFSS